jgi:AcrR family transcriptional regulator
MPSSAPRSPRRPLTRERVLRAAIALADDGGLESLSMRRLGQELGVEAMSLYNHVKNKSDLLDGITDLVLAEIDLPDDVDWKQALRRHAVSAHAVLGEHPWACNLALSPARTSSVSVRRADWMLRRLREGGLPAAATYHGYHALDAHILGFTLWQLGHGIASQEQLAGLAEAFFRTFTPAEYPDLHEHAQQHLSGFGEGETGAFELVLDLILDGLERMRDAA